MKQALFTLRRCLLALILGTLSAAAQAYCNANPNDFNTLEFGPIVDNDRAPGGILGTRELTFHITCKKDGAGNNQPRTLSFGTDYKHLPGTDLWGSNLPGLAMRVSQDGKLISNMHNGVFMLHPGDNSTLTTTVRVDLIRTGVITPGHAQGIVLRVDALPAAGGGEGHNVGTLHVTNTYVHGVACHVNTSSKNMLIEFGDIQSTAFTGPGSTPVKRDLNINLSCGGYGDNHATPISIRFVAETLPGKPDVLKLSGANAATGIGIRILKDNKPLLLNTWESLGAINSWDVLLPFTAQYYQVDSHVTPGDGNAALTFLIEMR